MQLTVVSFHILLLPPIFKTDPGPKMMVSNHLHNQMVLIVQVRGSACGVQTKLRVLSGAL